MVYIGCHLSVADGCLAMGQTALSIGADTFAWFTRNPRGGRTRDYDEADVAALNAMRKENRFGPLVAHASYTMNLASSKVETRRNALDMLQGDLIKLNAIPDSYLNFHPGANVGQGMEAGIDLIAEGLNAALTDENTTMVLLETMAGKGTEIGGRFEELRAIIDRADHPERIGVCFDTCHTWDAGYDIACSLDSVLTEFDRFIGLDRLKAIHLNDSKNPLGSHKDRHEKLGKGMIGEDALRRFVLHPALQGLPFILETPNELEGYADEIRMMRGWMEGA